MSNPFVIGIAGGTCSGKSTLCETLKQQLNNDNIVVLNMDDYFKEVTPTTIAPITRKEYPEHNHPDTLNLGKLYCDFDKAISNKTLDYVIIEGIFALYLDEIRERLDLKVFVDLQSDERIIRRIHRFATYGQSFDEIATRYLDTVRFRHNELVEPTRWHADIIVNGTLDMHKGTEVLLTYIKSHKNNN
ncbi:AAA family ATPase [Paludicola sp. MB14-C6]|uniref:uridine kinase family protein n=1 Tax=Paludihabitans sp. MB14-C6 TaxID=3070656 RepID=UPI0027DD0191|nr:zeta toxin family protein [Paludicola sp. MB14-C6]WMJ21973.1 AAA family ATPase [Paludicola sp. MB14-C6]